VDIVTTIETILIILLSAGFVVLLVLSIILVSLAIAVMKNVKRISERAEEATGNVAEIAANLSRRLAPLAFSGVAAAVMKFFRDKSKK
jgi:hypothetical protein